MKNKLIDNNQMMVNITVTAMLNPSSDLYIGSLTIEQLKELLDTDTNKDGLVEVFWRAFSIAQAKYLKEGK